MKIVVQRVLSASVQCGDEVRSIGRGIAVLLGIRADDFEMDSDYVVGKILNMQLWDSDGKAWSQSVMDVQGDVLIISQFTLYGYMKGNRPDFHYAMGSKESYRIYEAFLNKMRQAYSRVQNGFFGQHMVIKLENDGPCTIVLDSRVETRPGGPEGMSKIGGAKAMKRYEKLKKEDVAKDEHARPQ